MEIKFFNIMAEMCLFLPLQTKFTHGYSSLLGDFIARDSKSEKMLAARDYMGLLISDTTYSEGNRSPAVLKKVLVTTRGYVIYYARQCFRYTRTFWQIESWQCKLRI